MKAIKKQRHSVAQFEFGFAAVMRKAVATWSWFTADGKRAHKSSYEQWLEFFTPLCERGQL